MAFLGDVTGPLDGAATVAGAMVGCTGRGEYVGGPNLHGRCSPASRSVEAGEMQQESWTGLPPLQGLLSRVFRSGKADCAVYCTLRVLMATPDLTQSHESSDSGASKIRPQGAELCCCSQEFSQLDIT